ncbi:carbohydrate sulfotransferase 1-like [Liolophura sinensis]|uniref:carbohydrate sulfotransferase 1-like n=1 Tax=Liolophura sinensis TaxID=3198878 RepID=UPI0031589F2C
MLYSLCTAECCIGPETPLFPLKHLHFHTPRWSQVSDVTALAESTQVVILSYMRSGTSFLGKIFDVNTDALYVFEPLWKVCEHIVPSFAKLRFLNGSVVDPGTSCEDIGQSIIRSFLTCNLLNIDQSTLTQFWMAHGRKTIKLLNCIERSSITTCVYRFIEVCRQSNVRILKTIRARLERTLSTLEMLPHVKVIHLVRDPRAIISSRRLMGEYYHRNLLATGSGICGDMRRDIHTFKNLPQEFQGRILQIRYEDLSADPVHMAEFIYSYLRLEMPTNVVTWIKNNTHSKADDGKPLGTLRADSRKTASKWRERISWSTVKSMERACQDVLEDLGYVLTSSEDTLRNLSISLTKERKLLTR